METGTEAARCRCIAFSREGNANIIRYLFAMFLAVCSASAVAGTNTWTSMGLQGGTVYDLAFHPTTTSTMYAVAPNGFYRSSDSGATWQKTSVDAGFYFRPSKLAVAPGNPDHVYVGMMDGGAVRSVDRGITLSQTSGPFLLEQVSTWGMAASSDGSVIYYALNDSVYRSTDQGATRQLAGTLPSEGLISQLEVDPSNPQLVHASHFGGFYRSNDGAETWQPILVPPDSNDGVWGFALDPQNPNRIWVATNTSLRLSVDGGANWTAVLHEIASDIDIDPAAPNVIYVSLTDGRVMRSTDGGTSWTSLPVPQRTITGRSRLAIAPGQSDHLYIFGNTGIFSSNDAGSTWQRADEDIDATSPGRFSRTIAGEQPVYFPIAEYGIGIITSDITSAHVLLSPSLSQVAGVHPPRVNAVTAGGDQSRELVAVLDLGVIALSNDHGSNWRPASTPPEDVQITDIKWAGARTVLAATHDGIYRSVDAGNHWTSTNGLPSGAVVGSLVTTADPLILYATIVEQMGAGPTAIYRSTDGGIAWAPTTSQISATSLGSLMPHPHDPDVVLIGSSAGSFRTSDGGATWTALSSEPEHVARVAHPIAIGPTDPQILYFVNVASVTTHLFRSVDGGATFHNLVSDYFTEGRFVSLLIDATQPDRIIAALEGGGVREFTISPDLQLSFAPSQSVVQGRPTSLTMRMTNLGSFDATEVQLEAQLLDQATGVSLTGSGANCTVVESTATCSVGILRGGASIDFTLLATPSALGAFRVNAAVSARQPDPVSANNAASASVSIAVAGSGSSSGGGGGGGGGTASWALILQLALLVLCRLKLARSGLHEV